MIIVAIAWNVQLLHLKTQVEGHVDTVLYLPKTDPDQYCTHDDQDPCATNFPSYRLLVIALASHHCWKTLTALIDFNVC